MNIGQIMTMKNLKHMLLTLNSLYGHAMSQYLPYANFKWVNNINEIEQKLMKVTNNSSTEYILEVDLEYPQNYMMNIVIIH